MRRQANLKKRQVGFAKFDSAETPMPKSFSIRPRLINVCKIYNVSTDTLINYLKDKGYRNLTTTTLLTNSILSVIENEFQEQKKIKDIIRGETQITFVNSNGTSSEMKQPSGLSKLENAYREKILYLNNNIFDSKKTEIAYKRLPVIHSNFTDAEAINLCNKMSSSFTRKICSKFNAKRNDIGLLIYQIHAIANKALKLFGGEMLTFIYELRSLQFKNKTALETKTYDKVIPDFPMLSFVSLDASFKISFFLKRNKQTNKLQPDIRLFTSNNYLEIGQIDEQGYVLATLEKFKPQLNLFYEASENKRLAVYSGVETGNCDLCGRELAHPTSLRIGIGPICAKNNNIDTTIYRYK